MHCPPIVTVLCTYLPHSMSKNKMSTFLRLRAANKSTVRPISLGMAPRIQILHTHRLKQVREAATKIRVSGFLWHLLFCGGRPRTYGFLTDDAHADDAHAGLLATHVADVDHADDAKADDLDLDAEDLTDKDGDGNGTASMPVKVSSYVGMGKGGSKYRSRRHKRYVRRDAEAISHIAYRSFRDYEWSW